MDENTVNTLYEHARNAAKAAGRTLFKADNDLSTNLAKFPAKDVAVFLEYVCANSGSEDNKVRRLVFETAINVLNARELLLECVIWGRFYSTSWLLNEGVADKKKQSVMKQAEPDLKFLLDVAKESHGGSRTALINFCMLRGVCIGKYGTDMKTWAYSWGITKLLHLHDLSHSLLKMQGEDITPYSYLKIFLVKGPAIAVRQVLNSGDFVHTFNAGNPLGNSLVAIEDVLEVFEEVKTENLHPSVRELVPELVRIFTVLESSDHIGIALADTRNVDMSIKIGDARANSKKIGNPGYSNVFKKFLARSPSQKELLGTPDVVLETYGRYSIFKKTWEEFAVAAHEVSKSLEAKAQTMKKRSPLDYAKFMRSSRIVGMVAMTTELGTKQSEWTKLDSDEKSDFMGERIDPVLIAAYRSDPMSFELAVDALNQKAVTPAGPISAKGIIEESEDTDMNRFKNLKYAVSNETPAAILDNWATIADSVAGSLPSSSQQRNAQIQAVNARKIASSLRDGTIESNTKLTDMVSSYVPDFHQPISTLGALPVQCKKYGARHRLEDTRPVGTHFTTALEMEGAVVKTKPKKRVGTGSTGGTDGNIGIYIPEF